MEGSDKFSVLYCDHAIELIVKEKVRSTGESIFEKNGRTIDFHDAINTLINNKGVKIPEKADLELIHDQRNVIQHRGATVSKEEAEFYLTKGYQFIKRFLKEELSSDLTRLLPSRYYEILESRIEKSQPEARLEPEITPSSSISDFISAVLMGYRNLEIALYDAIRKSDLAPTTRHLTPLEAVRLLQSSNKLDILDEERFNLIRMIRNKAAHTTSKISEREMKEFMMEANRLEKKLRLL